jgi:uncharacterized Zn finger protein (UPF0148 family)
MNGSHSNNKSGSIRVELKYCEHCGGLWVREGDGGVYCEKCQDRIADMPIPRRKRSGNAALPVRRESVMADDFGVDLPEDKKPELEAAGGAA